MSTPVRQRDRQLILNALRAGVVPGRGLHHLQVGRGDEVAAISEDIRAIRDGGAAIRIVVGEYGSGKTFFLQVIKNAAQNAGCVTMSTDVTQDARLYGTGGRVRTLFSSLVASAGTKSQPGGGGMAEVLERFVSSAQEESRRVERDVEHIVRERLADLTQYRSGHEFADVVLAYWRGVRQHDDHLREAALRWLRGEYRTATEARQALGVRGIIGDADLYPMLRLMALLVKKAGYGGLVVLLDELAVLARLNKPTRDQNYEQILSIVNSLHGGHATNLMVILAGTPDFVTDPIRGLYSYGALRQRLSHNEFHRPGLRDTASPVLRLDQLSPEDLWVLLENVHRVYCSNNNRDPLPDLQTALRAFLTHAGNQLGGLSSVTPREATRTWLHFLDILAQNRGQQWHDLLGQVEVKEDRDQIGDGPEWMDHNFTALAAQSSEQAGDELSHFTL
ncbi:ATP-binding protein [Actinoplanes sp. URMC 104]|uniref:ATP-binding protein n=1 Tax=Actinoplanes sp. URMC 104 TaxID=3423409 RepID=UPI003F1CB60C